MKQSKNADERKGFFLIMICHFNTLQNVMKKDTLSFVGFLCLHLN